MGRQSPGKWIRNLFLGKKSSSKSNSSKKKDISRPSSDKDVLVVSSEGSMPIPTMTSPPTSGPYATKGVISENEVVGGSSNGKVILAIGDEMADAQEDVASIDPEDQVENIRLTEAAIIAQAAFRGYQARRTFRILKGIIPLQALIRGQLVRREAVSALYCVKGIVKFQALARGYKVRHSGIGLEVQKICKDTKCSNSIELIAPRKAENLSDNVFVLKLLASSPSAVSQHLKYDSREPNLAWEWLDRWTRSHFWAPLAELKKLDLVSDEKNGICQLLETNEGQVKRNARKAPAVRVDDGSVSNSSRYIQSPKNDSNIPLHSPKEHSQKENERSNSLKSSMQNVSDMHEAANEKRKRATRKSSDHTATDVTQQAKDEHNNVSHNDTVAVLKSNVKDGIFIEDLNGDGDIVNNKNCQRRASLPANFINHNNELQDTPRRFPSYMAPTESAKAKLRGQGSPRFSSDLVDKNSMNRRLSLSSSLNGNLGLFSPRSERLATMSSKGLIKTDRSLSSSRDWTGDYEVNKLIQPQWRR